MGPIINWQVRRHSGNEKGKKSRIGASFTKKRHPEHLNSVAFNTLNNKFISNIQCGQKATFFASIFWNLTSLSSNVIEIYNISNSLNHISF